MTRYSEAWDQGTISTRFIVFDASGAEVAAPDRARADHAAAREPNAPSTNRRAKTKLLA